jgi:hypothetical protein
MIVHFRHGDGDYKKICDTLDCAIKPPHIHWAGNRQRWAISEWKYFSSRSKVYTRPFWTLSYLTDHYRQQKKTGGP